jgi:hypothetical protein
MENVILCNLILLGLEQPLERTLRSFIQRVFSSFARMGCDCLTVNSHVRPIVVKKANGALLPTK